MSKDRNKEKVMKAMEMINHFNRIFPIPNIEALKKDPVAFFEAQIEHYIENSGVSDPEIIKICNELMQPQEDQELLRMMLPKNYCEPAQHILDLIKRQGGTISQNRHSNLPNNPYDIIVSIEDFFDGIPQDCRYFAANLGMTNDAARSTLENLRCQEYIQGVFIVIENFSNDDSWPYADTCIVAANSSKEGILHYFEEMNMIPDEMTLIDPANPKYRYLPAINEGAAIYLCWWD